MMEKSFIDLFHEQVIKTPGNTAVVFEGKQLSYLELNERSNQLATLLQSKGVKQETLVPLYLERGLEMIIGMLGIMKSGGAYVPIDTDFPSERINYILEDTQAKLIVTSKSISSTIQRDNGIDCIEMDSILNQPKKNPESKVLLVNLAYVIYTSGSTGTPKGVMVEHKNLVDYVSGLIQKTPISECETFALVSTVATDLGNTVIYGSLVTGGALHVFKKESVSNIEYLHNYFSKNKIDCLKIVPSHWKVLSLDGQPLIPEKLIIFGGEALQEKVVEEIRESGTKCRIINHYGPTETTIGKLLYIIEPDVKFEFTVPIGKPFSNTKILVLTQNLKLCPIGVPGQLYITGDGVARGYLNNPELTKEKFIQNPFSKQGHSVMYNTGDLVKYLPDGNISFIGRADNQVKIRGYRIELGEIESVLQKCGLVSQAVVLAKDDKQENKRLIAYIVAENSYDKEGMISYLHEKLPEYMIPSLFMEMENFPLTPNGKVDRNALPDPDASELLSDQYIAPRNDVEATLAEIWQEVLEVDKVGITNDFFELGGHSLLAVRLVSSIRKAFKVEMPISDIFDYPTVEQLATRLSKNSDNALLSPIEAIEQRPKNIPLSFNQERLWFIDRLEGSLQYHVPTVLRLKGDVNLKALKHALKEIINRHEILRTVIHEIDGHPYQHIIDGDKWEMLIVDGVVYNNDVPLLRQHVIGLIKRPFDLANDYMLRATLITLSNLENILVVTMHHIASDGWSKSVLVRELMEIYRAYEEGRPIDLSPLPIQYADYSIWQKKYLDEETLAQRLNYWKEKLYNVKVLQLPTDYPRPAIQSTSGASIPFIIDKDLSGRLQKFSLKNGCTLFMTLLATFKVLLYRYSNQQDICVGTAVAGRQQKELESLIGFFVNTLALRNEVNGNQTFPEFLQQVKATTLKAYEFQDIPFERVVDAVIGHRDLATDPLVQIMFALQNTPDVATLSLNNVELSAEKFANETSKFDLFLNLWEQGDRLQGMIQYCTDLYTAETIERMAGHYQQLLHSILALPAEKIGALPMLTKGEENQLKVYEGSQTKTSFESITHLFEKQVNKTPNAIALQFADESLTYRELNEQSNKLAHFLKQKEVADEMLIGICIERSVEMMVSILGILKAGGAYVPIDPDYPLERIKYMLEDTGVSIIISSKNTKPSLPDIQDVEIISIDESWNYINNEPADNLSVGITDQNLAYIIYTSGSTGKPKGVMVQHGNVVSLVTGVDYVSLGEKDVLLCTGSSSFDATTFEYWGMLLNGGRLVLCPENQLLDNELLKKEIEERKVNIMWFTTSWFNQLVEYDISIFEPLKTILVGGEKLSEQHIQKLRQTYPDLEIINGYGPTENTTFSVTYNIKETNIIGAIPIGYPLTNRTAYIVNEYGQINPVGVPGELLLGGAGLARGYLNSPELTVERFIENPFGVEDPFGNENPSDNTPALKLYKTGDLCKWLPNGTIAYIKRLDDQVKVRGYRIELGEIETSMNKLAQVNNSCVIFKKEINGTNKLVAYYIPDSAAVKVKEKELYSRLIASWKELYETEYAKTEVDETVDPEFNIIGWNDTFTGSAIPAEQMKEWLQDITEVIMYEKPRNVLEIGTGTGLIYYQLAGKLDKYIGTDFSRSSINQVSDHINKALRNYGNTELQVCAAHEVSLKEEEQVDTIVLNSIIQYFPGEAYMTGVIDKSISLLKGKGRIIIGDVRDNRMLHLFKGRLQVKKLQESVSIKELSWAIEQEVLKEEELCFSPDYFFRLKSLYPQISHVEIKWKKGSYINELTLYRFTVILHIGFESEVLKPTWQSWTDIKDKQSIINDLEKGELVAIKNVPNPRLWQEKLLSQSMQDKGLRTVGDILNKINKEDEATVEVNHILAAVREKGYSYRLLLDEDIFKISLVIESQHSYKLIEQTYSANLGSNGVAATNVPLFTDINLILQKDIKYLLHQTLPDYMVPAELIALAHLPLTNNGKADRQFLSEREEKNQGNKLTFVAPRNKTEEIVAGIWQDLLGVERVGINDNFFELGGHSLLATRAVSAIRKKLNVEIVIKDIFVYASVAQLVEYLASQTKGLLLPPIEVQQRPENIPLSFSQERLWFIDQLQGSQHYHIPVVLRLKGNLNKEALAYAIQTIVNRHEVLRTIIYDKDGVAYQEVLPEDKFKISTIDGSIYKDDSDDLKQQIEALILEPFDLAKDHMVRVCLVYLDTNEHLLVVTTHHIASDGWSMSVIVKEVVELYNAYQQKRPAKLSPLQVQYADYAIWQRKYLDGEVLERKIHYWNKKLSGVSPLEFPTDHPRPVIQSQKGAKINFLINKDLVSELTVLSQKQGATLFMTLLAAFKVLLHRYTGQEDICVGTPIANRLQAEVEDLIGFFVNTLALRSETNSDMPFTSFLQQVKDTTMEAYENQELPFEKVVESIGKERDLSRTPIFQVMFVFQNTPEIPALQLGEVQLTREGATHTTAKFDLTFNINQAAQGFAGTVEYCTDLFTEQTIHKIIYHFNKLLSSIVKAPGEKLGDLAMLSNGEKDQVIFEFNNTKVPRLSDKNVVDLFEEQVEKSPDSIAVIFEEQQLTYEELNKRSNQLARYLRKKGVHEEILVPICVERSMEMIIGILGILKAGGAYVPIDPEYPEDRINYMLEDIGAGLIISSAAHSGKLEGKKDIEIINAYDWVAIGKEESENLELKINAGSLAYVIYTSGSTGRPKGAMNEHRGIANRLTWAQNYFKLTEQDTILQKTTFSFDVSVWELLWPITSGAKMVFAKPDGQKDNSYIKAIIEKEQITMLHFVPSMLAVFLPDINVGDSKSLKKVLCSGEALNAVQVNTFREKLPGAELHNLYGPTETAIDVTCWSMPVQSKEFKTVPIGKPVSNTQIYILRNGNIVQPVGIAGEIYIGGVQVGRGYLKKPELTAEKFIKDEFSRLAGAKLYRTGDLGKWLPDGNVEYLGRIDDQVKIRGYRIELGEIESVIGQSKKVKQAVVLAKEDQQGNKRLVSYIVPEGQFDKEALTGYLQKKLPEYMIPAIWVVLEQMSLTSNGKIDKRSLPEPDAPSLVSQEYVAPRNEVEEKLAGIWQQLLGIERIGINDNFFELGGDSILTIQVVSRAKRFGYNLQPRDIFIHQTIKKLSQAVAQKSEAIASGEQGFLTGEAALLPVQQWYLETEQSNVSHFNQKLLLKIDKAITPSLLTEVIEQLSTHHDALRFKYSRIENGWKQEYGMALPKVVVENIDGDSAANIASRITALSDAYQQSLNIEEGDIVRVALMQTPDSASHNRMLIVIHHLVIDGVSWRVLVEDMEELLNGVIAGDKVNLGYKTSSYRQWYEALERYSRSERLLSQKKYWQKPTAYQNLLNVDKDYSGSVKLKDVSNVQITLDAEQTRRLLQEVPRAYHTEINDILLCALAKTLCDWNDENKIIIGMEGHGREEIDDNIDISKTVGWFTSMYPLLLDLKSSDAGLDTLIKSVKEQVRQVPDKGLGYGVLKYINKEEVFQQAAPFEIIFNYLGQVDSVARESKWFSGSEESAGESRSSELVITEKLFINSIVRGGELVLTWLYSTKHFKEDTVKNIAATYIANLEALISHCLQQQKAGETYTPSDYGLGEEISFEELDQFLNERS